MEAQPQPLRYLVFSATRKEAAKRLNDASADGYLLMSSSTCVIGNEIILTCIMVINPNVETPAPPTKHVAADGSVHDVQ